MCSTTNLVLPLLYTGTNEKNNIFFSTVVCGGGRREEKGPQKSGSICGMKKEGKKGKEEKKRLPSPFPSFSGGSVDMKYDLSLATLSSTCQGSSAREDGRGKYEKEERRGRRKAWRFKRWVGGDLLSQH